MQALKICRRRYKHMSSFLSLTKCRLYLFKYDEMLFTLICILIFKLNLKHYCFTPA